MPVVVVCTAALIAAELAAGAAAMVDGLLALLALVECPLIRLKVREAAKASGVIDRAANAFFTLDLFIFIFFALSQI